MTAARARCNSRGTAVSGMEVRRVLGDDGIRQMEHSLVIFAGIAQPPVTRHQGMQLAERSQAAAFTRSLDIGS